MPFRLAVGSITIKFLKNNTGTGKYWIYHFKSKNPSRAVGKNLYAIAKIYNIASQDMSIFDFL